MYTVCLVSKRWNWFNLLSVSRLVCLATSKSIGMHQSVLSAKPKVAHATLKNLRENQTSDTCLQTTPEKTWLTFTIPSENNLHINALTYACTYPNIHTGSHHESTHPHCSFIHTHTTVRKEWTICSLIIWPIIVILYFVCLPASVYLRSQFFISFLYKWNLDIVFVLCLYLVCSGNGCWFRNIEVCYSVWGLILMH